VSDALAVTLSGMRFHARVGILPHERELPQPLEIDLTVWPASAARGSAPLDYRLLYQAVAGAVAQQPLGYLEDLAHDVCDRAFACGDVTRAVVRVRKPHVTLGGPLAYAEIALDRATSTR
jgi:7,8-dihydroneopterin aldolase/epimerase/oxygenase